MKLKDHKYEMGIIGNCSYTALVAQKDANIKWLCWPRFDSSFIFGSLLDDEKGGEFSVHPEDSSHHIHQEYMTNTNILSTRFECKDGVFEVIDFAPRFLLNDRYHRPSMLFRKIRKISGSPRMTVRCAPMGNYGEITPGVSLGSHHLRFNGLDETVRLTTNASLTYINEAKAFVLSQDLYFVLSWGIPLEGPLVTTFEDFLTRTKGYWQTWVERCGLPQMYQHEVIRSALTLKLHQYEDTGGIIASCTTSLPEIPGESRNWDYRFCWLRDSYYTLSALNSLGQFEEMEKYAHFIENLNMDSIANLQPVYGIDGRSEMPEYEMPLKGYLGSQPVRLGNGAADQVQHDAYGQILLSLMHLWTDARIGDHRRFSEKTLKALLRYIERTMQEPDNGVWEFRGQKSIHTYTLLFHWAGSSVCLKIARVLKDAALEERALACQAQAKELIEKCYSPKKKAYAQALGGDELDASLLQMITLGYFHDQPHERAVDHLRAIQKELELEPGFFLRYKHEDDFGHQKSSFLVCSFWYIEALITLGFVSEAEVLFERVLKSRNHLGLMSEGFEVTSSSQLGNFPQTYSHVGLINCAFALAKATKKPFFL